MGDARNAHRNFAKWVCEEDWRKCLDRMPTGWLTNTWKITDREEEEDSPTDQEQDWAVVTNTLKKHKPYSLMSVVMISVEKHLGRPGRREERNISIDSEEGRFGGPEVQDSGWRSCPTARSAVLLKRPLLPEMLESFGHWPDSGKVPLHLSTSSYLWGDQRRGTRALIHVLSVLGLKGLTPQLLSSEVICACSLSERNSGSCGRKRRPSGYKWR